MNDMEQELMVVLDRIAVALERIADSMEAGEPLAPANPTKNADLRTCMLAKFAGQLVTIEEAREALGGTWLDASAKAIGQALSAAGFERRRWSTGVKYAINADGSREVGGAPIQMPAKLHESVEQAREAKAKFGRKLSAEQVLFAAYLLAGAPAKPNQVTAQHVAEVHRLYPNEFE